MLPFSESLRAYKVRKRISYSELVLHSTCGFRHKLAYIQRIKISGPNIFSAFGQALHKALELHLFDPPEVKFQEFDKEFQNLIAEIRSNEDPVDDLQVEEFREQGKKILDVVLDEMKKQFGNFQVIGSEQLLEHRIEEFTLDEMYFKGFVDLIIKDDQDVVHVIDFKTTSFGWLSRKKSDPIVVRQLVLYKHFFSKITNIPLDQIQTHFVLCKRTVKKDHIEVVTVTSGNKRIENAIKWMVDACTNIYKLNFIKNRFSCGMCEFKGTVYCPLSTGKITKQHKIYKDTRETQKEKVLLEEIIENNVETKDETEES